MLLDLPTPPTAIVCDDPRNHQELQRAHLVRRKTDGPLQKTAVRNDVSVREELQ